MNIDTLGRHMMCMYIHDTLIPMMLEVISNGKTKAKLLVIYGITTLFQDAVVEWLNKLGFKHNYAIKN